MEHCKLNFVEFKLSPIVAVNDTVSLLDQLLLAVQRPMRRRPFRLHRRSDGELPECKLLVDTVSMSIEDLESISVWMRDAKKLKVRSDIIESLLSELPSSLNCIEDVIDTFLVKTELQWGLKLLLKMTMMHPLISFTSLQEKTVLSLESFYIDTGRNPLTKRPPIWQPSNCQPLNWQPPPGRKGKGPKIFRISDDFKYFVGLAGLEQEFLSREELRYLVHHDVIAVTGKAGSGKTTLTKRFITDHLLSNVLISVSGWDIMKMFLGLFPRVFQIPVRRLLHSWLAEGLVTPLLEQNMASEDLPEKYFKELINRGLIEVARLRSDGSPKTCHMPGILWDFFPKAVDSRLFHAHNTTNYTSAEPPKFNVQRLAEYVGIKSYPSFDPYIQYLRSYISFDTRKRDLPAQEIGAYKPMLPEILRKFLHLKYLGLRWTLLDSLPKSIVNLPYLETLDVEHLNIITLQSSIGKAKNLRHLYLNEIHFDVSLQRPSNGSLTNLRTLWEQYIGNKSLVYNCLNKLTAISKLGLTFNSTSDEAIAEWISYLTNLRSLRLRPSDEFGRPEALMLGTMTAHQKLSDLYLLGQLPRAIQEHELPPNLKILTLSASKLEQDPMLVLGQLCHLNILRLLGNSFKEE
ncbi:hypothetical protein CMV_006105 [Castanea mollissima]|uniref:Uncharacterized protein n=1 Tax=Castanea mollissima TaxID=60419 RepID=A0A8J4RBA2_9ROSI|nr:hypothetical protein CMV_006105 [Castanea mollissima]